MQASIAKLGLETQGLTAREFAAKLDEEARNWEAAVNESGVKLD
jgi:tripartite-type tricarboxylate transporter receptor subunit TctC